MKWGIFLPSNGVFYHLLTFIVVGSRDLLIKRINLYCSRDSKRLLVGNGIISYVIKVPL